MKLRQLECFKEVMAAGTMTAAASRLGTSQPGVSNLIASLEHEIGFKLFAREKGRLIPTPEAGFFYQAVEQIISGVADARRTAKQIAEGKHGSLTVATLPGFGLTILPPVISRLRKERPGVRFKLLTRSTDTVRSMIPAQQCDVAIVETPVDVMTGDTEILRLECVAILPAGHPLAENDVLTPKLLAVEPIVALYPDHPTTQQMERAFFASGVSWAPAVESRFFMTNCELVATGAGIAVIDPVTADRHDRKAIVIRKFRPKIVHEVAITFPDIGARSRLAQDFVACMKEELLPYL